jgi:hypothetical protein
VTASSSSARGAVVVDLVAGACVNARALHSATVAFLHCCCCCCCCCCVSQALWPLLPSSRPLPQAVGCSAAALQPASPLLQMLPARCLTSSSRSRKRSLARALPPPSSPWMPQMPPAQAAAAAAAPSSPSYKAAGCQHACSQADRHQW